MRLLFFLHIHLCFIFFTCYIHIFGHYISTLYVCRKHLYILTMATFHLSTYHISTLYVYTHVPSPHFTSLPTPSQPSTYQGSILTYGSLPPPHHISSLLNLCEYHMAMLIFLHGHGECLFLPTSWALVDCESFLVRD